MESDDQLGARFFLLRFFFVPNLIEPALGLGISFEREADVATVFSFDDLGVLVGVGAQTPPTAG